MNSKKQHPVIKHLLARRNKKVPVKDGRKIALVLFGGGMAGIRGAGAVIALEELGLNGVFNEIYSQSAGFANASYFLAKSIKLGTSIYYEDLSGNKYINFLRLWNIADSNCVVNAMRKNKYLDVIEILKSKTKLFSYVKNKKNNKSIFLEIHKFSPDKYLSIMEASIKMPYLSPGSVKIEKNIYKDIFWSKDWIPLIKKVFNSKATDILIVYNYPDQYSYIHKYIDFSKHNGNVCEICPKLNMNIFETNPIKLKKACLQTGNMVKKIFGSQKPISLKYSK
jgi:predicted patatin/cPLA2 family phospholipase